MKRCREIRAVDRFSRLLGVVEAVDYGGFDAGEAEIVTLSLVERGAEAIAGRVALFGKLLEVRSAGIREAKHACDLVKRLARCVVPRTPDQAVAVIVLHEYDVAVPTGRHEAGKRRLEFWVAQIVCRDVGGDVVHAQKRQSGRVGKTLCVA